MIVERTLQKCRYCGAMFMAVDWMKWRVAGYCCKQCQDNAEKDKA